MDEKQFNEMKQYLNTTIANIYDDKFLEVRIRPIIENYVNKIEKLIKEDKDINEKKLDRLKKELESDFNQELEKLNFTYLRELEIIKKDIDFENGKSLSNKTWLFIIGIIISLTLSFGFFSYRQVSQDEKLIYLQEKIEIINKDIQTLTNLSKQSLVRYEEDTKSLERMRNKIEKMSESIWDIKRGK